MNNYCDYFGVSHNFLSASTPQQNGAVKRKNKTFIEIVRTMLNEYSLPNYF